jgi:hypothetical protein
MQPINIVQVSNPCEISAEDLHDAYVFCKLRRIGIGYVQAIETPAILKCLRNTAIARERAKQQSKPTAPKQWELIEDES